jgi:hypothetical protein
MTSLVVTNGTSMTGKLDMNLCNISNVGTEGFSIDTATTPFSFSVAPSSTFTSGSYSYYVCTASCTLTPNILLSNVIYFAVGGGGGGGGYGAAGGAGGLQTNINGVEVVTGKQYNPGNLSLSNAQTYTIVIGSGGGGTGAAISGSNGGATIFSGSGITTITANGGGGGGGYNSAGLNGGCGGGAPLYNQATGGTGSQGGNGGNTAGEINVPYGGAGGGGIGGNGSNRPAGSPGDIIQADGGPGITFLGTAYGGGGGGGTGITSYGPRGVGGSGGGGDGGNDTDLLGINGSNGTGGGGGGGGGDVGPGGTGGTGVFILGILTSQATTTSTPVQYGSITINASSNLQITASSNVIITPALTVSGTATFLSNTILNGAVTTSYTGSNPGLLITGNDTVGGAGYINFLRVTNTSAGVTNPNKTFRINSTGVFEIINSAYTSNIFNVTDAGLLNVGGGLTAATLSNSATTNYLSFGTKSDIYDDGNFHIHTRNDGGTMWINTRGGQISMISQTIAGGSLGTGVGIGTSNLTAYVTISGSKTYAVNNYGYLAQGGAGQIPGGSGNVGYSIYASGRMQAVEFDATSDERLKDISGGITSEEAIRFVQSVSGMYYSWKSDPCGKMLSGFIAQDIHRAGFDHMVSAISNADMVGQVDDDGFTHPEGAQLTLNYSAITPYHHEAIKYLLDRVARLEAQISSLLR